MRERKELSAAAGAVVSYILFCEKKFLLFGIKMTQMFKRI
jgi:hypothetical protein